MIGQGPAAPPEAVLIHRHRETLTPPMSRRQAATQAGISPSQWSDIERGTKKAGNGITVPVQATARTLARMAQVIGVTPDDLTNAGRHDAACELHDAANRHHLRSRLSAIPGLGSLARELTRRQPHRELLPLVARGLDAIDDSKLPERAKRELTALFTSNLLHDATRRNDELLLILRLTEQGDRSSPETHRSQGGR